MTAILKCECGKEAKVIAMPKKQALVRDQIEPFGFCYEKPVYEDGKLKEICFRCKCGNWIFLSFE